MLGELSKKQKQSKEVFYKKSRSQIYCNIYRKTPVLESLFNKGEKHLRTAASVKKDDKGWDREDYITEAEEQLSNKNIYEEANFRNKILQDLTETSNDNFKSLERKRNDNRERT